MQRKENASQTCLSNRQALINELDAFLEQNGNQGQLHDALEEVLDLVHIKGDGDLMPVHEKVGLITNLKQTFKKYNV